MPLLIKKCEMQEMLYALFLKYGFNEAKALSLANVHTESTLAEVNSYGVNRVPLFIDYIEKGLINDDAEAEKVGAFGSLERWGGNLGPGIINAMKSVDS